MKVYPTLENLLGGCTELSQEARKDLLDRLDSLADATRGQIREETREMGEVDADLESRAISVIQGIELGGTIVHAEGVSALLGFLTGMIIATTQAVFKDDASRSALVRAMGTSNRLKGQEISAHNKLTGDVSDTIMGLSQLMSTASFLSLLLTEDADPPEGDIEVGIDGIHIHSTDGQPATDMPPAVREAALRALGEGKMVISDEVKSDMAERGMTEAELMDMVRKAMLQG